MRLDKTKNRLAALLLIRDPKKPMENPHTFDGDKEKLGELARDLGHELPRNRLDIVDEFRADAAMVIPPIDRRIRDIPSDDGFVRGYLAALLEVAAAYSAAVQPELDEKEAISLLLEKGFKPLLLALMIVPSGTVDDLSAHLLVDFIASTPEQRVEAGKSFSPEELKNKLHLLCEAGIAEGHGDPMFFRLTLYGERIVERLKKENK